jgi:PKD repeat protein
MKSDEPRHGATPTRPGEDRLPWPRQRFKWFVIGPVGIVLVALAVLAGQSLLREAPARPTARFTMHPRSGGAPLDVTFENLSRGADGYLWDFGDGGTASGVDPGTHRYEESGTFTVRLVASGLGGADTTVQSVTVTGGSEAD